jgi:hypothetical protein
MTIPHRLDFKLDILTNLVIGIILTVSWMLLIDYIYISNYTGTWEAVAIPLTPILSLIVVPLNRIISRKISEAQMYEKVTPEISSA